LAGAAAEGIADSRESEGRMSTKNYAEVIRAKLAANPELAAAVEIEADLADLEAKCNAQESDVQIRTEQDIKDMDYIARHYFHIPAVRRILARFRGLTRN